MNEREVKVSPVKNYHQKWTALGKTFKRKGQAEKYIWDKGFGIGKPIDESWISL